MCGIRGVPWICFPQGHPEEGGSSALDDEFGFSLTTTTCELIHSDTGLTMELLRVVFFATNWPLLANTPEKLDRLIDSGYEYNFWRRPGTT